MKITAAEAAKNFGQFADNALVEPVTITKYGRDHLVLLSAAEYDKLKRGERRVWRTVDLPDDLIEAIRTAEPPAEASNYDHEYAEPVENDKVSA